MIQNGDLLLLLPPTEKNDLGISLILLRNSEMIRRFSSKELNSFWSTQKIIFSVMKPPENSEKFKVGGNNFNNNATWIITDYYRIVQ